MYQVIAENVVSEAEKYCEKSPEYRFGAISVAIDTVSNCRQAALDETPLSQIEANKHIYSWTDELIARLRNLI